jgi:hypothetical protein
VSCLKLEANLADVFIAYSRKDTAFVQRLNEALKKINRSVWVDWQDIPPTAEWLKEVFAAIEGSDTIVFVISPESVRSKTCRQEVENAVKNNKRLVPIVYKDVDAKEVPEPIARLNWIFFRKDDDFECAFKSLIEAIDTDLDWVRAHTRLVVRSREWESSGHDKSLLLRGTDLKKAEQWLSAAAGREPRPTALQVEYTLASREAEVSRQRSLLIVATGVLIITIILAFVALHQRQQAVQQSRIALQQSRIALSRQLAAQAVSHLDGGLDLALLLGLEACRAANTFEARSCLLSALTQRPGLFSFLWGHAGPVNSVAFSPDSSILASGSWDNTIVLWDVKTRKAIGEFLTGHRGEVNSVSFSPDGSILASGSRDQTVVLWDTDIESWKTHACRIANRNLTKEEWKLYLGQEPYRKTCPSLPGPVELGVKTSER